MSSFFDGGSDDVVIFCITYTCSFRILCSHLGTAAIWANYLHPCSLKKLKQAIG